MLSGEASPWCTSWLSTALSSIRAGSTDKGRPAPRNMVARAALPEASSKGAGCSQSDEGVVLTGDTGPHIAMNLSL
jgi:hypothetical protein